jgi:hypothetical protein
MGIHRQEESGLIYAYCFCGVVGPLRVNRLAAVLDESAHHEICTARKEPS